MLCPVEVVVTVFSFLRGDMLLDKLPSGFKESRTSVGQQRHRYTQSSCIFSRIICALLLSFFRFKVNIPGRLYREVLVRSRIQVGLGALVIQCPLCAVIREISVNYG
jgi:hypothetical protein